MKNKASLPIGTIAIIIIVLIAGIGMWWWFTRDTGPDCSEVIHDEHITMESWRVIRTTNPYISSTEGGNWGYRLFYQLNDGSQGYTEFFADIDDLDDLVNKLPMTTIQKDRAHHLIDCIRADCPNCQVG